MIACLGPEDNCKMILSVQCKSATSVYMKNKIKIKIIYYKMTRKAFQ